MYKNSAYPLTCYKLGEAAIQKSLLDGHSNGILFCCTYTTNHTWGMTYILNCFMFLLPVVSLNYFLLKTQDGQKPIQVAATRGNKDAVEMLLPLTTPVQSIADWTIEGIIKYMQSETQKQEVSRVFHFLTLPLHNLVD